VRGCAFEMVACVQRIGKLLVHEHLAPAGESGTKALRDPRHPRGIAARMSGHTGLVAKSRRGQWSARRSAAQTVRLASIDELYTFWHKILVVLGNRCERRSKIGNPLEY
jgi:transposase InsO family protein